MFCCDMMMRNVFGDDGHTSEGCSNTILYLKRFDEYLLPINTSAVSGICITFCPWCGRKLPDSKREKWFEELDQLGLEFSLFDTSQIPLEYLSDEWWRRNEKK